MLAAGGLPVHWTPAADGPLVYSPTADGPLVHSPAAGGSREQLAAQNRYQLGY